MGRETPFDKVQFTSEYPSSKAYTEKVAEVADDLGQSALADGKRCKEDQAGSPGASFKVAQRNPFDKVQSDSNTVFQKCRNSLVMFPLHFCNGSINVFQLARLVRG